MNHELGIMNYEKWKRLFFVISMSLILNSLFLIPQTAHAQLSGDLQNEIRGLGQQAAITGLGENAASDIDARVYALRIVRSALGFVGLALILFMLYGGFLYITSQGNEEKLGVAKKVLTQAAVGTAIIFSSYGVTVFMTRQLVRAIYTQMIIQVQGCGVSGGEATCCAEWNAYQTELSRTIPLVPLGEGEGLTGLEEDAAQRQRQHYENWHSCFERETERAGLDSNLFD